MPTIDVESLLERTFITEPDKHGDQHRATIEGFEETKDKTADGTELLYKFKCKVGREQFEQIQTYNQMLQWVDQDIHHDPKVENIMAILHHRRAGAKWELLVEWEESVVPTWVPFDSVYSIDPATVAIYGRRNKLLDKPGWKRLKRLARNTKKLARMVHHFFDSRPSRGARSNLSLDDTPVKQPYL